MQDAGINQPSRRDVWRVSGVAMSPLNTLVGEAPGSRGRETAGRRSRRADLQPVAGRSDTTLRVALIAPYAAGNLGDGAMQDAVIRNLRRRHPRASLIGITLAPRRTAPLHRIPAFGITGRYGGWCEPDGGDAPQAGVALGANDLATPPMRLARTRGLLKNLPGLGPALRRSVNGIRTLWGARREPVHLLRSLRLARSLDALVIAGSGQLDERMRGPWGHPYALFRWAMIARLTRTPLLALSLGRGDLHTRLGLWFVRHALATAVYRSYRDPHTRDSLKNWGFTREDPVVPDLAFSDVRSRAVVDDPAHRVHVAISPTYYGGPGLSVAGAAPTHESYMEALVQLVAHLVDRGDRVSLFVTADSDRPVMDALRKRIGARLGTRAAEEIGDLPCSTPATVSEALADVDLVVGSRLHSIILAHCAGCSALAISTHRKVDSHMSMVGESDVCLQIDRVGGGCLIDAFDRLAADRVNRAQRIQASTRDFDRALQEQYEHVMGLIRPGARARV